MISAAIEAAPTVSAKEKRARLAERLRQASDREARSPLSFAQQRLWFLDQLEPNTALYNVPLVARLRGTLNVPLLEQSLQSIVARHEALRTRFECQGETPVQVVTAQVEFKVRVVAAANQTEADGWIRDELRRPFNLIGTEPLLRAALVCLASDHHLLALNLHHIVADEWSLKILFRELEEFYKAHLEVRKALLPRLPIQYSDFAAWQRDSFSDESLKKQLRFWKSQLHDKPPVTELMTDRPRGQAPTFAGRTLTRHLDADLARSLKQLTVKKEATLFIVLLAAFKALVHRYTGLEDIIIGTPVAGRNRVETEALIGFFVNTLMLRTSLNGDPTFEELLHRVRGVALGAYAHQDLPFEKVVEALRPERSSGHLIFSNLMFTLQAHTAGASTLPGLAVEWLDVDTGTSKFDLTFVVQDFDRGMTARVEYNSDLFESATISRMLEHFENLLRGIAANPAQRISELPMLGAAERRQLLVEWNSNTTDYPRNQCIHQLFEARVQERPDSVAVVFAGKTLTYRELNARANQLAHGLGRLNIKQGAPVAVCLDRSTEMVVALLAILKAGGSYVPMDPRYPKERLSFMLNDSRTSILLTQQSLLPHLPRHDLKSICLDADAGSIASESQENLPNRVTPQDIAYIIYTSGSTGHPKGVAVPHRAVNRLVLNTNYIALDESDRISQVSNISFDAATFEIWGALLNGGQLRGISADVTLSPVDFARELCEQGITAMFLTSALFSQVAGEVPGAFETLRTLIAGGEALDPKSVRAVLEDRPPLRLLNGYGPTENTTFTCCGLVRNISAGAASVPIGRPISNTQVYILDAHRQPVPIGVPGELYAGGDGLAQGYWNRPELTGEKFILHQFSQDGPCHQLYRTGDLARFLPDGNIEFLGRIDQQVKIRGFRVELGEIEAVLGRNSGVRECAVKICGQGAGLTRLVAYYVPAGKRAPKSDQLRSFLADQLPDYMVPSAFVQLTSLPLTPNGKVDRRALPEPDRGRPSQERKYASPRDAVEVELTRIWEEVLGIEPIGIEDQFFDLGGHSLLAVQVAARIEKTFGRKLRLATIFRALTIEQLAAVIRAEMRECSVTAGTSLVELQAKGTRTPLFLVHGAGGGMFWGYVNLARRLGSDQPVFGFSSRGLDGRAEFGTIEEMAAQYMKDLQVVQPRGPYYLGGYCFGGNVAYEMARQLESRGEKVALLALLNCAPPNSGYMRVRWTPTWCARFLRNLFYWADYCRQWTASQRRDFLRWKWGRLKHWLARRLRMGQSDVPAVEAENLIDLAALPEQQRELWQSHIGALMKFHPQAYSGCVHLFRSPGHPLLCSFEADYGWSALARQGVDITIVRGAHEKILEEPWVDETAAKLKKVLEETREEDLVFWKRELAGAPSRLELPADHSRAAVRTRTTGVETRPIPSNLVAQMEARDRSVFVLTALNIVLYRYTGQEDLLVGVQIGGNQKPENLAPLRTSLAGNPSGRDLLGRVRAAKTTALQHGDFAFKDLLAEICPTPEPDCHPLVQIFFTHGLRKPPEGFDLHLCLIDSEQEPTIRLEYAADLFSPATIQRMLGHLETTLQRLVETPEPPLSGLSILTRNEEDLLLRGWNQTESDYPRDKTLIQLFEEQAARTPAAEALVCGAKRFTYRELSERATRVANHLRILGVGNQSLVGICLERSEDMLAAILGTLQAGGAYVPLDPAYPKARLATIAQDAGLKVLLTRRKLRDLLPATETPFLCVEDLQSLGDYIVPPATSGPEDLAYVLYTSGSTGQPKGVALEHRSAVALVSWARQVFKPDEISGVLASTSICFDLSVFEMFVPLSWGGKVILADNALALPGLPAANEVTLVNTVPSAIRELLRIHGMPASVRVVNLAGEPLATALVEQIYKETSVQKVYDLYGPTETTTYSTFALRQPGEPPTIGRPLANEQVYILDKQMQLAPIGVPGDLYIGGVGLARGYLNRPDWTAERFLAHPFLPGARVYKTGDIARWRDDGNLVFMGRSDHQVKIRGFRIELGEIESALKSHPGVADAIVIAREDRPGEKRLAAYVVTREERKIASEELRRAIRQKLPDYMTPASFVFLPKLPLTPNGKVDRRALPEPQEERTNNDIGFMAPQTDLETKVAAVWSEVLGLRRIGLKDNFIELGGHSLAAIQVISRLRESINVALPLSCVFEAPTVEALADGLNAGRWKPGEHCVPSLERIPRDGILPASFMQEQLWFLNQLEPVSDAYNVPVAIRFKGRLDMSALQQSFDMILQRHEALRATLHFSEGTLQQAVAPSLKVRVGLTDLAGGSETSMLELLQAEARRPFDLEHGPLVRASVVRLAETDHALVIIMHHAVSDGWSLDILFRELEAGYRALASGGPTPAFSALPIQYVDYARWQRCWMQGVILEMELNYWREKLAGAPLELDLPANPIHPRHLPAAAARSTVQLPEQVRNEIVKLGQTEGGTAFMVLMTALAITLHKWTGQKDMVLGTVVAGRSHREIEGLIGCFMNFIPLRFKIDESKTGLDALRAVKAEVIESQTHQDCPFEKIVESMKVERRPGRNPLYNVALLYQNNPTLPQFGAGLESSPIDVHVDAALLDLRFEANEIENGIVLTCEYKSALFIENTIERLLASFCEVLEMLTQSPQTKLQDFELKAGLRRTTPQAIAVCGTFTTEPLEVPLRFWLDELEMPITIKFAPFDQVFQQLLDPASTLATNRHGLNILLIRLNDWEFQARFPKQSGASAFGHVLKQNADEFVRAIHTATARGGAPILVCFCPPSRLAASDPSKSQALAELEAALASALGNINGVVVTTTAELSAWYPVADYDDPSAENLGHIPYTPLFFTSLATLIARKFHTLQRPVAKVIALDCDQTLWSGVCGEDGPMGIRLDPPRQALQQFMRHQQESGKLLVVCSKNEESDVRAVFGQGPAMPLKQEHFSAWRVNWQPKSENLKSIAQELKLGLDSFVFIDDNPLECAEVEANCPEVLTLQLPEDPALIPQFLDHCWAFDQLKRTEEDKGRAAMYAQNQLREQLQAKAMSFADFIEELELEVRITQANPGQLSRVAQLTQRTNQFNVSGRRYTEGELKQLQGRCEVSTVSVKDRFGDYGLVGAMIFEIKEQSLVVDSFLLSCRALGRGVEHRMLGLLGKMAQQRGAQWVDVSFERSPRNQPALDFLESVDAPFKQQQQFRFPADSAAKVIFDPHREAALSSRQSGTDSSRITDSHRKFIQCRKIALESRDAETIHARIEARLTLRPAGKADYVAPRTQMERQLCEIWQNVLRVERVGIEDDFFDLGGHSLMAVRLFSQLEKMVGRKLPLVTLFQAPTVVRLAAVLSQEQGSGSHSVLVPIQPHGSKPPLYLIHGAGGDVLWGYANLVAHMDPEQPIYALKSRGQTGLEEFERLENMAEFYLQAVRAHQPEGPYYLGGYCFGGNVAYEMARQLHEEGSQVALLALLDSAPANAGYENVQWWRPEFVGRFGRNLYYWLQDFRNVKPLDRRRFIARKLRTGGRKLARWVRGADGGAAVDLEEVIDPAHFPEHELKLWEIHLRALTSHVQRPYAGHVTLFRTKGHPLFSSFARDLCWGALASGGVTVKLIPGSHENIFMEPNVKSLALALNAALSETRERVASVNGPVLLPT
jgi:amino acid adenylation domain-containing protein/FkbH-like protein